jgi:hypothetical protein
MGWVCRTGHGPTTCHALVFKHEIKRDHQLLLARAWLIDVLWDGREKGVANVLSESWNQQESRERGRDWGGGRGFNTPSSSHHLSVGR